MTRSEAIDRAELELREAFRAFSKLAGSHPVSKRNAAEQRYGQAYQVLVKLGARPPLKLKYQPGIR